MNTLMKLLALPNLGLLIEWSYVGCIIGLVYWKFYTAWIAGQLPPTWILVDSVTLCFVIAVYLACIFEGPVNEVRFTNMLYHSLWGVVVYCTSDISSIMFPLLHLVLFMIVILILFALGQLCYFAAAVLEDWKQFNNPDLKKIEPPLEMPDSSESSSE